VNTDKSRAVRKSNIRQREEVLETMLVKC